MKASCGTYFQLLVYVSFVLGFCFPKYSIACGANLSLLHCGILIGLKTSPMLGA